MISYRGVESTDCFGMQPVVEPVLGLCGNLKPNRFFKTERKRFFKGLAVARPFIFDEGNMLMDLLQQSAHAWIEMTEYKYLFTYGYKKRLYTFSLTFSLSDYPHLAGFQYMKDLSLPNHSNAKIASKILEGKISFDNIKTAAQYEVMIKPRLQALVHLKESLDNDFNLYSYMPRMYPFTTNIKADYLISSHLNIDNYIFIIIESSHDELKCDFLCCSIFAKGDRDYEANQRLRKLMKKERIHLPTNTHNILLNKLSV